MFNTVIIIIIIIKETLNIRKRTPSLSNHDYIDPPTVPMYILSSTFHSNLLVEANNHISRFKIFYLCLILILTRIIKLEFVQDVTAPPCLHYHTIFFFFSLQTLTPRPAASPAVSDLELTYHLARQKSIVPYAYAVTLN